MLINDGTCNAVEELDPERSSRCMKRCQQVEKLDARGTAEDVDEAREFGR